MCLIADGLLQEPWPGIEIFNLPKRNRTPVLKYLLWMIWTRRFILRWQPDILHAHRVTSAGWLGAFSGFHPFIVTPWGSDLYQYPQHSTLATWLTRRVLSQADLVTADAQDLCRLAIEYGAPADNTHLVQWGVDLELFHPVKKKHELRQRLGFIGDPVILCPRAMHPIYNLDILLRAVAMLKTDFPNLLLVLRDYNTDPVYRSQLEVLVKSLNLVNTVIVVPVIPWEKTVELYQAADLVISVPSSDSTPVSVLEAMACGVPVIATDLPALREWIQPGVNGWLVPVRQTTPLRDTMLQVLKATDENVRFREENIQMVRDRANQHVEMTKMEMFYQGLLA